MIALDVKDVSVAYGGGRLSLRQASLKVGSGSVCGLVGMNGAGKSTLFKTVMGFKGWSLMGDAVSHAVLPGVVISVLVVAMLITPGATAYLLTDKFSKMLWIAVGCGVGSAVIGTYGSYFLDGATGACIVLAESIFFVLAFIFAPKHGQLTRRRQQLAEREGELGDGSGPSSTPHRARITADSGD